MQQQIIPLRMQRLATKKSSLESHIRSQKHVNRKKKLALKNKEEADIVQALNAFDSEVHPVGNGLPFSTRVYRVKVVSTMLRAGVPLGKIDLFRDLLEEHAYALTSATHLRQLIPFILQEELSRIRKEILHRPLSIIFDGTTHVCEAFVIILRYLTDDCELKHTHRHTHTHTHTHTQLVITVCYDKHYVQHTGTHTAHTPPYTH